MSRLALVALGATAPLAIWDFVNYSLLAYLGDAFDLGLMFDLTGRAPDEVFAVASSHLVLPACLILVAIAAIGGIVWALNRYGAAETRSAAAVSAPARGGRGGSVPRRARRLDRRQRRERSARGRPAPQGERPGVHAR